MYKSVSFSSFGTNESLNIDLWKNKVDISNFSQVARRKGAVTLKYKPIIAAVLVLFAIGFLYYYNLSVHSEHAVYSFSNLPNLPVRQLTKQRKLMSYNHTYPLTKPVSSSTGFSFRIGMISDMDTKSKYEGKDYTWRSILRFATFKFNNRTRAAKVKWKGNDDTGIKLFGSYAYKNRGMELSELVVFNGRVYSIDDRTGIIYEIAGEKVSPWVILSDGNGHESKGFKGEWMAVKDEKLYIGGLGKKWTTGDGTVLHSNPQWIKVVDKDRSVSDVNWISNYEAMQNKAGFQSPGYIIHESAAWSDVHRAWFFLPRRASRERYNEDLDEHRGTNLLFKCSDDFSTITYKTIGTLTNPERGFSSFKFIPGTNDHVILALKTEEVKEKTKSYITVFTINGDVLLPDTTVSLKYKFEGVEFL